MEDKAVKVVLQALRHRLHAGGGNAKHGQTQRRLVGCRLRGRVHHHAGQRMRRVGQHLFADAINALHVRNRIHHADIARTNIGPYVPAGHGADHDFGHADGQCAHGRCCKGSSARAASRNDAAQVATRAKVVLECLRHRSHGTAAVSTENRRFALRMMARNFARVHARR